MDPGLKPLFVRLAADDADRLDRAAEQTGQSKRRLVESAVRSYLPGDGLVVGRASLNEAPPEVLTEDEAAGFLRLDQEALLAAAERGEIPGRRIGDSWRFSRAALLGWLACEEERDAD